MGKIKVLAGDFLDKDAFISLGQINLKTSKHSIMGENLSLKQIEIIKYANKEIIKSIGEDSSWGEAESKIIGPGGLLANMETDNNKKKKKKKEEEEEVTFVVKFKDGRKFLGTTDKSTFIKMGGIVPNIETVTALSKFVLPNNNETVVVKDVETVATLPKNILPINDTADAMPDMEMGNISSKNDLRINKDTKNNISSNIYIGKSVNVKHLEDAKKQFIEPEEIINGIFHGYVFSGGGTGPEGSRRGGLTMHDYLIITNNRVIMWARGVFTGNTSTFPYPDISSVEEIRGVIYGEIVLNVRGAKERIEKMISSDVPIAAKMIRKLITENRTVSATPETHPATAGWTHDPLC